MDFDHQLELMNTYRGVPFICKARVLNVQDDQVEIETHDPALICLVQQKQTRVLGSDYFEPAVASVVQVDLLHGMALLNRFTYQSTRLGERMIVRVEPKAPIPVQIKTEDQSTNVELVDLSLNGMGVRVATSEYNVSLKPGTNIQASMQLLNEEILLGGNILTAIRSSGAYRLSIRFLPNNPQRVSIFRYLIDRRKEIALELQEDYDQALRQAAEAA